MTYVSIGYLLWNLNCFEMSDAGHVVATSEVTACEVKTVIVSFDDRARPVKFTGGKDELLTAILTNFADVHQGPVYLQIRDDTWGCGLTRTRD